MDQLDKVTFYKNKLEQWEWVRVAANGEIVGASTEGYHNFRDCNQNFLRQSEDFVLDVCVGPEAEALSEKVQMHYADSTQ